MKFDIVNDLGVSVAVPPVAALTNANTPYVSTILDTQDKHGVGFLLALGAVTDADATLTFLLEESNAANMSGANTVAAGETNLTQASAGATFASDNAARKIGYLGSKRYIRATITPAANDAGSIFLAGMWVWKQGLSPIAQPTP